MFQGILAVGHSSLALNMKKKPLALWKIK